MLARRVESQIIEAHGIPPALLEGGQRATASEIAMTDTLAKRRPRPYPEWAMPGCLVWVRGPNFAFERCPVQRVGAPEGTCNTCWVTHRYRAQPFKCYLVQGPEFPMPLGCRAAEFEHDQPLLPGRKALPATVVDGCEVIDAADRVAMLPPPR